MMESLFDRIRRRVAVTRKSYRRASLDGGLSGDTLGKVLGKPESSPSLETIRKLAIGLHTTPEWLAYGIGAEEGLTPSLIGPEQSLTLNAASAHGPMDRGPLPDNASIQLQAGELRRFVSGALQTESIPEEQADAHADAVLEALRERLTFSIVLHLAEPVHKTSGSAKPKPIGRRRSHAHTQLGT